MGCGFPSPLTEAYVTNSDDEKQLDRRHFLKCMAWVGTGAVWTLSNGVLKGAPLGLDSAAIKTRGSNTALRFVQISDSHIGFDKPANTDVTATLRAAIARIKAEPEQPSFILHTGDLTHLSKPSEFDTLQQVMSELSVPVFYVPGEHDVLEDDGASYVARFGKGTRGAGWHSFDHIGVHFIGLVNVVNLKAGGLLLAPSEDDRSDRGRVVRLFRVVATARTTRSSVPERETDARHSPPNRWVRGPDAHRSRAEEESVKRLRRNPANRGRHHQAADAAEEHAHANQSADRPDLAPRKIAHDHERQQQRDDAVEQEPP